MDKGYKEIRYNDVEFTIFFDEEEDEIGVAIKGDCDCVSLKFLEDLILEAKNLLGRS